MNTRCIVVIGHVDHGKTALVRALTGTETDRLPEEKQRGLSIAPGFAHHAYATGTVDFIDAPGHEDFIQAMVSGATGAQSVLLVISAVEGIKAQTLEHLRIAALLGITNGLVAVTKSDLVPVVDHAARLCELANDLSQTPFANAPMILCSPLNGEGIDDVHDALQTLVSHPTHAAGPLHSFLPIDRVFSLPGFGTIVTGTLLGPDLSADDTVILHPDGRAVTFRNLQSRGATRDTIHSCERVAANLRAVAANDVKRGAVLTVGSAIAPSQCLDVKLDMLPTASRPLKHMEDVRVLFGTSSEVASVRLFGGTRLAPLAQGYAQLRFKKPVVGFAGQRAVLRFLSPTETSAGAIVLDPNATVVKSGDKRRTNLLKAVETGDSVRIAQALCLANHGIAALPDVTRLSRKSMQPDLVGRFEFLAGGLLSSHEAVDGTKAETLYALNTYHAKHPLHFWAPLTAIAPSSMSSMSPILVNHVQKTLLAAGHIRLHDTSIAAADHNPIAMLSKEQRSRVDDIETAFRSSALAPPAPDSFTQSPLDGDLFKLLIDSGCLVALHNVSLKQTLVFHADTLAHTATRLRTAFPAPQVFTTSDARATLGTSRRIIIPVLEYFDAQGLTIRTGNNRHIAPANSVSSSEPT